MYISSEAKRAAKNHPSRDQEFFTRAAVARNGQSEVDRTRQHSNLVTRFEVFTRREFQETVGERNAVAFECVAIQFAEP